LLSRYCKTATLLGNEGTIGESLAAEGQDGFRVVEGGVLEIHRADDTQPLLTIDANGQLESAELCCDTSEIRAVLVCADRAPSIGNVLGALGKLGELTAHTVGNAEDASALASNMLDMHLKIVKRGCERRRCWQDRNPPEPPPSSADA
jgi:hypothetical protein